MPSAWRTRRASADGPHQRIDGLTAVAPAGAIHPAPLPRTDVGIWRGEARVQARDLEEWPTGRRCARLRGAGCGGSKAERVPEQPPAGAQGRPPEPVAQLAHEAIRPELRRVRVHVPRELMVAHLPRSARHHERRVDRVGDGVGVVRVDDERALRAEERRL